MQIFDDQRDLDPILLLPLNVWLQGEGVLGHNFSAGIGEVKVPDESREDHLELEERCERKFNKNETEEEIHAPRRYPMHIRGPSKKLNIPLTPLERVSDGGSFDGSSQRSGTNRSASAPHTYSHIRIKVDAMAKTYLP
jgi:hypothetical protein